MELFKLKDYDLEDTIAAIATYPAKSALGVIKISGKEALRIVTKIFRPARKKDMKKVKTFTLHYGWIVDPLDKKVVDEVLVSVMRKPFSYTREDVVEISSHGGILVLDKILKLVLREGARLAKPGEFSWRAFINGRVDLLQVQSILNIVEASTEKALFSAAEQLKGDVSSFLRRLKERVKNVYIHTQAIIDFPEEEIEVEESWIKKEIERIKEDIEKMEKASSWGQILKEGIICVICGKANVGKSTLFNSLIEKEKALVTKIAGTTRDAVEESINIGGIHLHLYDIAGIMRSKSLIERKAIEKSFQKLEEADIVIFIFDYSRQLSKDDYLLLEKVKNKKVIYVINKIDLKRKIDLKKIRHLTPQIKLSALRKVGLDKLKKEIISLVSKEGLEKENAIFLTHWQREILKKIKENLRKTLFYLDKKYTIDFVNLSLKEIIEDLDKIMGVSLEKEILEPLFSQFCIGK